MNIDSVLRSISILIRAPRGTEAIGYVHILVYGELHCCRVAGPTEEQVMKAAVEKLPQEERSLCLRPGQFFLSLLLLSLWYPHPGWSIPSSTAVPHVEMAP